METVKGVLKDFLAGLIIVIFGGATAFGYAASVYSFLMVGEYAGWGAIGIFLAGVLELVISLGATVYFGTVFRKRSK